MTTAIIKFTATAELNLDSDTFPPECDTPEKKLQFWMEGAKEEPLLALAGIAIVQWKFDGEIDTWRD